jgi:hypothetical protein
MPVALKASLGIVYTWKGSLDLIVSFPFFLHRSCVTVQQHISTIYGTLHMKLSGFCNKVMHLYFKDSTCSVTFVVNIVRVTDLISCFSMKSRKALQLMQVLGYQFSVGWLIPHHLYQLYVCVVWCWNGSFLKWLLVSSQSQELLHDIWVAPNTIRASQRHFISGLHVHYAYNIFYQSCMFCFAHCPVSGLCKDLFRNRLHVSRSSVIHGLQVRHGVGWSHFTEKVCCLHLHSERMVGVNSYWDRFSTSLKVPKIIAKQEMRSQFLMLWITKHISPPWK